MGFLGALIPSLIGGVGSLLGAHSKNKQADQQAAAENQQRLQEYQLQQARRNQKMGRYKVNLALVRSWLEQHPNIAAKAPKEYIQAVYHPQFSEAPAFSPTQAPPHQSALGAAAMNTLGSVAANWPKPQGGHPPLPGHQSGGEGSTSFMGPLNEGQVAPKPYTPYNPYGPPDQG